MRPRRSRRLYRPKRIHDPIRNRTSLRRANVRPSKPAPPPSLMLLCGGWFPGASGDRQLIRPRVGRVSASRAHPARLTAEWFLQACDGRLQILLAGRLGIFRGKVTRQFGD